MIRSREALRPARGRRIRRAARLRRRGRPCAHAGRARRRSGSSRTSTTAASARRTRSSTHRTRTSCPARSSSAAPGKRPGRQAGLDRDARRLRRRDPMPPARQRADEGCPDQADADGWRVDDLRQPRGEGRGTLALGPEPGGDRGLRGRPLPRHLTCCYRRGMSAAPIRTSRSPAHTARSRSAAS